MKKLLISFVLCFMILGFASMASAQTVWTWTEWCHLERGYDYDECDLATYLIQTGYGEWVPDDLWCYLFSGDVGATNVLFAEAHSIGLDDAREFTENGYFGSLDPPVVALYLAFYGVYPNHPACKGDVRWFLYVYKGVNWEVAGDTADNACYACGK